MPGGGRRTHHYPYGRPFPLVVAEILMVALSLAWFVHASKDWKRILGVLVIFAGFAVVNSRLHSHYEQTGEAIPLPKRHLFVTRFPNGMPPFMLAARVAFFVVVAIMLVLGFAAVPTETARRGIIACVFGLIAVAIWNISLGMYYVNIGEAKEENKSSESERETRPR